MLILFGNSIILFPIFITSDFVANIYMIRSFYQLLLLFTTTIPKARPSPFGKASANSFLLSLLPGKLNSSSQVH